LHETQTKLWSLDALILLMFLIAGFVTYIWLIPIYNRRKRISKGREPIHAAERFFASCGAAVIVAMIVGFPIFKDCSPERAPERIAQDLFDNNGYWLGSGGLDYSRMPLLYPYELFAGSPQGPAEIRNWRTTHSIIGGVRRYHRNKGLLIGIRENRIKEGQKSSLWFLDYDYKRSIRRADSLFYSRRIDSIKALMATQPDSLFFIFDCKDGSNHDFDNVDEFKQALMKLGYNDIPSMPTVYKNWRIYVRVPRDSS